VKVETRRNKFYDLDSQACFDMHSLHPIEKRFFFIDDVLSLALTSLVALEGPGTVRTVLRQALTVQGKLLAELERKFKRRKTHQDVRSGWLVNEYSRELLSNPHSVAIDLFGGPGVERLIAEQTRAARHSMTIAYLLTAEEFRRLSVDLRADP